MLSTCTFADTKMYSTDEVCTVVLSVSLDIIEKYRGLIDATPSNSSIEMIKFKKEFHGLTIEILDTTLKPYIDHKTND